MRKIFKSRTNNKSFIKKFIMLLLISFFSAYFLNKINLFHNERFTNLLKKISMNELINSELEFKGQYLFNIALSTFDNIKFTKEVFQNVEVEKNEDNDAVIYIYNTHQTEEYETIANYNLTPTVLTASYILKDLLKDYGINSIVEDRDLKSDMNRLGYTYKDAYKVSRNWLNELGNKDMKLYIDLHRDSINYKLSNITIDGKDYAKIMFVVGTNYNYQENMNVATSLVNEIESINNKISRGIFTRTSVYNQDFNENCVLIEVGGPNSTYESVSNSLSVLALAIKNYLGE
ncbi:MAG: stage II sporulation protein P [Bacilli bacterium]|nr:stage II sporulation protein P [Bacilli bacterium]